MLRAAPVPRDLSDPKMSCLEDGSAIPNSISLGLYLMAGNTICSLHSTYKLPAAGVCVGCVCVEDDSALFFS